MREKADPNEANLLPGNASGRPLQDIKKFWKVVTEQAGIADFGYTTIGIPTRRASFRAA
jgi:hypothetical protein